MIYIYISTIILLKLVFFHCHPTLPSQRLASCLASLADLASPEIQVIGYDGNLRIPLKFIYQCSTHRPPKKNFCEAPPFLGTKNPEGWPTQPPNWYLPIGPISHDLLSSQPATLLVNASAFPSSAARCKRERSMTAQTSYDVSRYFTDVIVGHQH